jgi:hypothetical protein
MVSVGADERPPEQPVDQQRETVRDSLFIQATLAALDSGITVIGRVRNLSAGGMMVEAPAIPRLNQRFGIELRGVGYITARVAWVSGRRIGFAFDHPIDPKAARRPVGGGANPSERKPLRF